MINPKIASKLGVSEEETKKMNKEKEESYLPVIDQPEDRPETDIVCQNKDNIQNELQEFLIDAMELLPLDSENSNEEIRALRELQIIVDDSLKYQRMLMDAIEEIDPRNRAKYVETTATIMNTALNAINAKMDYIMKSKNFRIDQRKRALELREKIVKGLSLNGETGDQKNTSLKNDGVINNVVVASREEILKALKTVDSLIPEDENSVDDDNNMK